MERNVIACYFCIVCGCPTTGEVAHASTMQWESILSLYLVISMYGMLCSDCNI